MQSRPLMACLVAEIIGTFILVFFGLGAVHTAVILDALQGAWQVAVVWGIAIMLSVYLVEPISGAHINPAITCSFALWGLFPWQRVLGYVVAQVIGAMLAATTLWILFDPMIAAKEAQKGIVRGEAGSEVTAACYGEYFPNPAGFAAGDEPLDRSALKTWTAQGSMWQACFAEALGTAILAMMVLGLTDPNQTGGPKNLAPVFIGLTVSALICVIAPLTQACFNPARDIGPRVVAYFAGWGPTAIPGPAGWAFANVYILAPILGATIGAGLYQKAIGPAIARQAADQ